MSDGAAEPAKGGDADLPSAGEAAAAAPSRRVSSRVLLRWGLALAILVALALVLDLGEVAATLGRLRGGELVLILLLLTLDRVAMGCKWWLLLRALGLRPPLSSTVRVYYQASLVGLSLPIGVGSDVLRGHWIARLTGAPYPVYASVLMEKMIGLVSASSWAVLGAMVLVSAHHPAQRPLALGLGLGTLAAGAGGFFLSLQPRVHEAVLATLGRREPAPGIVGKAVGVARRFYEAYAGFGRRRPAVALNLLLSLGEQGLQMAIVLVMARSLGITADAVMVLAVIALHAFVYRFPLASGGWGIGELSAIGLYALIGIGPETAFALALLINITWLLSALPGLPCLLLSRDRIATARRAA